MGHTLDNINSKSPAGFIRRSSSSVSSCAPKHIADCYMPDATHFMTELTLQELSMLYPEQEENQEQQQQH